MKTKIFIFCLALLTITGCKKYEEGPAISFSGKKARIAGKWETKKYITNDLENAEVCMYNQRVEFEKDGTYRYSWTNPYTLQVNTYEGSWAFRDEKNELLLGLNSGLDGEMHYELWTITLLKNKEIHLEMVWGDYYQWWLVAE